MKRSWCAFVVVAALAASRCSDIAPLPIEMPSAPGPRFVRVKPAAGAPIARVELEDYVRAAILSEFAPPAGDPGDIERMLEVQAVIARTYAVAHMGRHKSEGFDLCATTHCQLYQPSRLKSSSWAPLAEQASARTAGLVLWYGTAPASALFHADCGGRTSAATDIWGGTARPYLKSIEDGGAAQSAHTSWRYEAARAELLGALNADPRTRVGRQLKDIAITHRDSGGRATLVTLKGTRTLSVRAEDFRTVLTNAFGAKSLRSARFDITRQGTTFVFAGKGYGHGVGLCQAGAYARLRSGARLDQVLNRYYPGTRVVALR